MALGGHRHLLGQTFFEPTVLTEVTQEMKLAKELAWAKWWALGWLSGFVLAWLLVKALDWAYR